MSASYSLATFQARPSLAIWLLLVAVLSGRDRRRRRCKVITSWLPKTTVEAYHVSAVAAERINCKDSESPEARSPVPSDGQLGWNSEATLDGLVRFRSADFTACGQAMGSTIPPLVRGEAWRYRLVSHIYQNRTACRQSHVAFHA